VWPRPPFRQGSSSGWVAEVPPDASNAQPAARYRQTPD